LIPSSFVILVLIEVADDHHVSFHQICYCPSNRVG
jgi:hypothetical protein